MQLAESENALPGSPQPSIQGTGGLDALDRQILRHLDKARSGDPASAVMTAMLIHLFPANSRALGVSAQYDWLLSKALQCSDGELLVCTGEEILRHKRLGQNSRLAQRFFLRADAVSGFMGSYVLGRLFAVAKQAKAIDHFRVARKAGHIPSAMFEIRLSLRKIWFFGRLLEPLLLLGYFLSIWRGLKSEKSRERFWRYRDSLKPAAIGPVGSLEPVKAVDLDRSNPFVELDAFFSAHPAEPQGKAVHPGVQLTAHPNAAFDRSVVERKT